MFDCPTPTLVFITQTHHPILEYHTGYLFGYYDFHLHKPQELFFEHIYEAKVFALYRGATLEMDPAAKPGIVTAQEYTLSGQDESLFMHIPDMRTDHTKYSDERAREAARNRQKAKGNWAPPTEAELELVDQLLTEVNEPEIDWFGEE